MYGYGKRWWEKQKLPKLIETDDIATLGIEIGNRSARKTQGVTQRFTDSFSVPLVIDSRTWHAMEKDKKSTRKAFKMINEEIEKIVREMP